MESYIIYPFQIGIFNLVICISVFSMSFHGFFAHVSLAMNNNPLSGGIPVYLWHSLIEGHVACFHVLAVMDRASVNTFVRFCVGRSFQFLWVNTNELDCWVVW